MALRNELAAPVGRAWGVPPAATTVAATTTGASRRTDAGRLVDLRNRPVKDISLESDGPVLAGMARAGRAGLPLCSQVPGPCDLVAAGYELAGCGPQL